MRRTKLNTGFTLTFLVILVASLIQIPTAHSIELTVKDKATAYLSDVIGLDLTKYDVKIEGPTENYQSNFGPSVKEENVLFILESKDSQIRADFVFENGLLWYCHLTYVKGSAIYKLPHATNILEQSKGLIQQYQTYASQNFEADTSHIQTMRNMLNSVSELKPLEKTAGNIELQISTAPMDNIISTTLQWVYTENGVDIPRKSVALYFWNETLSSMTDTWNLLTIGSHSLITQKEALDIAWEKAKDYTLTFTAENGSTLQIKPDLSNVTSEVFFSMTTRNSTALYPLWTANFYFNKEYYGAYGIQVGLWGDTKEVVYCESLITLGNNQGENPTIPSTNQPTASNIPQQNLNPAQTNPAGTSSENIPATSDNPVEDNINDVLGNAYLIAGVAAVGIAVVIAMFVLKKGRSK